MIMEKKVLKYIEENRMLDDIKNVIVGVSGGADSVCLLLMLEPVCRSKNIGIAAAHINHGIRETAARDEEYVRSLCEKLDVPFFVHYCNIHELAKEKHISVEEAGRMERYGFFKKLSNEREKCVTAVAHNANDNAETILFNLMRGSGLQGLCGIKPVNSGIIRPLLCCEREEIEDYLKSRNIGYMTDETNLTLDYSRNVIRNVIISQAKEKINPAVVQNINRAGEFAGKAFGLICEEAERALNDVMICVPAQDDILKESPLIRKGGTRAVADSEKLLKLSGPVREEVIRRMIGMTCHRMKDITARHVESVMELLTLQSGRQISLPYSMVVRNSYSRLIFDIVQPTDLMGAGMNNCVGTSRNDSAADDQIAYETDNEIACESDSQSADEGCRRIEVSRKALEKNGELKVGFFGKNIKFRLIELEKAGDTDKDFIKKQIESKNNYTKCLDYDKIKGNIFLRTRQEGDYISIEGGMKKKLKKYFSDIKLDRELRDKVILVAEGASIIYAIPYRAGSSYFTDTDTRRILVITEEL